MSFNISLKKYNAVRMTAVVVIAVIIAQSVVARNFLVPIAVVVLGSLFLMYIRGRVTEVIADERDWQIGGRSALLAIQIYSWIAVISMFLFYYFGAGNPVSEAVAETLGFSTCGLMLAYSIIFKVRISKENNEK